MFNHFLKICLTSVFAFMFVACGQKDNTAGAASPLVKEAVAAEVEAQPPTELYAAEITEQQLDTYGQTCGTCHDRGLIGAPKTGDVAAWSARLEQGMDTLVEHVRNGFKAMPPAGLCYSCSDDDYQAMIGYMSSAKPEAGAQ